MRFARLSLLATVMVATTGATAQAQYADLVRRLPSSANTILLLNVEAAESSALGVKEGWRESHEKQFAAGLILVPPHASTFVMAAQMEFPDLKPRWQVALCDVRYEPSMPKLAARLSGTVDEFDGRSAAVLPGDICVVKFGPRVAGIYSPAIRQDVARWLNSIDENYSGKLSPYMAASVEFAKGAPLIMAMDLSQMLSAAEIRPNLTGLESLKGHEVDLDRLATALASIQGVSLGVTISERRFGKIKVDFAEDVSFMSPYAKPLLLEVLGNHGAMIDEFAAWEAKTSGKQITLEGTLLASGSRRILSLLDAPPDLQQASAEASQSNPDDPQQKQKLLALGTQQYFKQVKSLLDDLKQKRTDSSFFTWSQLGIWVEKYARKVDALPILNVDPEMVEYGAWVAKTMREAANALKGIGPEARLRQIEVPNFYSVQTYSTPIGVTSGGAYGWGGWTATPDYVTRGKELSHVRTQEKIRGTTTANSIAQGIEQATADMRRYMTVKYQVEF